MFARAAAIANNYTYPIVVSARVRDGRCTATLGAFVVLNKDGWVLTAGHIVKQLVRSLEAANQAVSHDAAVDAIRNDKALSNKARSEALRKLGRLKNDHVCGASGWWAHDQAQAVEFELFNPDLALVRLDPFPAALQGTFPEFKNPANASALGTSLARTGFPFHQVEPQWIEATGMFELPAGTVPVPHFVNECVLSRLQEDRDDDGSRLRFIETSSAGLKGQSGGPIFDAEGRIWAIQTFTISYPLGFEPKINGISEHQFLNVGVGVHVETVVDKLRHYGVAFDVSAT